MDAKQLLTSEYVKNYKSPVLVMNKERIIKNVQRFNAAMPRVQINYAVKANPSITILQALMVAGTSFEVASLKEIGQLQIADNLNQLLGYEPFDFGRVLYSNPVRPVRYIEESVARGVTWFVVDSVTEINKVFDVLPTANMYLRVIVSNKDSFLPLTGKFGVDVEIARDYIYYCKRIGANLRGITFHVGSQCPNPQNWIDGIATAKELFAFMSSLGMTPDFLDMGGGFPVQHATLIPDIDEIGKAINGALTDIPDSFRIVAEPGRFLVSDAGHLLCQVVSTTHRLGREWVYLDIGVFHGLVEGTVDDFKYVFVTEFDDLEKHETMIAGPTCDSLDMFTKPTNLPLLDTGDAVVVQNAGAYTTSYGTEFNGFPSPYIVFAS